MIPELRQSFDTSTATIAWGIGAFFFPFAALLLVSGTLGKSGVEKRPSEEPWCCTPSHRWAAQLVPLSVLFSLGVEQPKGAFKRIYDPLLIATPTDLTPKKRIGRAVGT